MRLKRLVPPSTERTQAPKTPLALRMGFAVALGLALLHAASAPVEAACQVGLEVRTIFDSTRPYGGAARPVRIILWYPATVAPAHPLPVSALVGADWISTARPTAGWNDLPAARRAFARHLSDMRAGTDVQQALTSRTCAGWLTPVRPGRFPLVLIGSGMAGRAYYHSQLAEDMANAGFVVAFVSGLGPTPDATLGVDAGSIDALRVDAAQALGALGTDVRVDLTRVGLVGWSAAGVVQLAIARDAPDVRAVVSLDSGVGYDYGPRLWLGVAGGPPRAMPYLHLAAGVRSPVPTDDSLLKHVGAAVRVVRGLSHAQFTDLSLTSSDGPSVAHAAMRRAVVDFLLAHVAR